MAKKSFKDTDLYTILFATAMVVIVGVGLAALASATKPNIDANRKLEKQMNILQSVGINPEKEEAAELFKKNIKEQITLDKNANVVEGEDAFNINLKNDKEHFPLYIAEVDGKTYYIAPLYGKGLWDDIWGYMSLTDDLKVNGVVYDHKGETPGLGAEITEDFFEKNFVGENILDANGKFAGVTVKKGNGDPANSDKEDNEVDAISGATLTCNGVTDMILEKLGVYAKYIQNKK